MSINLTMDHAETKRSRPPAIWKEGDVHLDPLVAAPEREVVDEGVDRSTDERQATAPIRRSPAPGPRPRVAVNFGGDMASRESSLRGQADGLSVEFAPWQASGLRSEYATVAQQSTPSDSMCNLW